MATGHISKRSVDALQPRDRDQFLWDDGKGAVKGFGLKVTPAGRKVYLLQYRMSGRSPTRRFTIGTHGTWTPDAARSEAERLARMVETGIDPIEDRALRERQAAERKAADAVLAFDSYCADYLKKRVKVELPRSYGYVGSALRNHAIPVLGTKPLPSITTRDILAVIEAIPADQQSVRRSVFSVLRKLFRWAKAREDIPLSPLDGMEAPKPVDSRDRTLSVEELSLALRAAGEMAMPFGPFYRLLFSTGQRREEVAGLIWGEVDRANALWTLPASRTKNSEANLVPLNRHAIAALDRAAAAAEAAKAIAVLEKEAAAQGRKLKPTERTKAATEAEQSAMAEYASGTRKWPAKGLVLSGTGETPVSGYSRAKARLDADMLKLAHKDATEAREDPGEVELSPWRLHDARRTLATGLQKLGVRFEVTEAVLNHTSGASRTGVAAVYQRHDWGPEKRAALDAWADHCDRVLLPPADTSNVVALRLEV